MTVTVWKHTVYIRPLLYLICLLPTKVAQFHNNLDTFSITTSGRKTLTVTQSFCDPQPLAKFRLHAGEHGKGDYSDHTAYESMLELSSRGWVYQQRPGSKQLPSYKKGGHKVWYYCKHICRQYLQVLLLSESLFAAGLQEICHFQATAYYRTLIFLLQHPSHLNSVKPRQTLNFYKLLQQQVSGRSRRQRENQLESESGGWQWVRSLDFQFYHKLSVQFSTELSFNIQEASA